MPNTIKSVLVVSLWFLGGLFGTACCPKTELVPVSLDVISIEHIGSPQINGLCTIDTACIAISDYGLTVYNWDLDESMAKGVYRPNTVYATEECQQYNWYYAEEIVDIKISSTRDYNSTHPAGSALNDIFDPLGQYDRVTTYDSLMLELNRPFYETPQRWFYLGDSTATQFVHRFVVAYTLDNNKVISDTTGFVRLLK